MNNTLVCPFLENDPKYAFGCEFGMLYSRLKLEPPEPINGYFCRANQDQILLAASRLGWTAEMPPPENPNEPWLRDWFWLELEPPQCSE